MFSGCERFFRPGYAANLVAAWIPALDRAEAKLQAGARVADVGCGHGASTTLMARAYPGSFFTGSDYHEESVIAARKQAAEAGLAERVRFDVASAQTFAGGPYDLVTSFDCLHDMGDPLGAARNIREQLAPDGTWMIVEPAAGGSVTDNLNPVGASTTRSPPSSASRTRCPRTAATPSARRPARSRSGGWPPTPASPASGGWRRRRSTSSTRPGRNRLTSVTRRSEDYGACAAGRAG